MTAASARLQCLLVLLAGAFVVLMLVVENVTKILTWSSIFTPSLRMLSIAACYAGDREL
jgi:hypothetical protein